MYLTFYQLFLSCDSFADSITEEEPRCPRYGAPAVHPRIGHGVADAGSLATNAVCAVKTVLFLKSLVQCVGVCTHTHTHTTMIATSLHYAHSLLEADKTRESSQSAPLAVN